MTGPGPKFDPRGGGGRGGEGGVFLAKFGGPEKKCIFFIIKKMGVKKGSIFGSKKGSKKGYFLIYFFE
jgi:hypothetical protein